MSERLLKMRAALTAFTGYVACALLFGMLCLVLMQVFTRYVMNDPASFTEELVRYMLIWTGFIGSASAFGSRQHMALLILPDSLPPARKGLVMALVDFIVLAIAAIVLLWGGIVNAASSMNALSPLLGIPRGLVYAVTPASAAFLIIIQIINIYEHLTSARQKEAGK